MESSRHEQHIWKGVSYGILAAISFTAMSLFGKLIGEDASTDTIVFARFVISFVLLIPWVFKNPRETVYTSAPMTILARSVFTLLAFGCFFFALKYISLSNALLLNNTYPLFIPLFALVSGKSHTPHKVWIGIVLGFIGVGLILNPGAGLFKFASLIALAAGIFAAISILIIRKLTHSTSIIQILFYNFSLCSLITGILLPLEWQPLSRPTLLLLLCVGLFGAAYQFFSTLSYAKAPVRITSSLMFLCILFGVFIDWLLWDQVPNVFSLAGMAFIILGGIITIYFGQKEIMSSPPNKSGKD